MERRAENKPAIPRPRITKPLELVNLLSPQEALGLWGDVLVQLTRLDLQLGHTCILLPQQKINIVQHGEPPEVSNERLTEEYAIGLESLNLARRDIRAAIIFCHPEILQRLDPHKIRPEDLRILAKLKELEAKSQRAKKILDHPRVTEALTPLPHVAKLFKTYVRYLTLAPIMEPIDDRYGGRRRRFDYYSAGNDFLSPNGKNCKTTTIREMAQKCLFAKWYESGTNFFGQPCNKLILNIVAKIFSLPGNQKTFSVQNVLEFFSLIMHLQYNDTKDSMGKDDKQFAEIFPRQDGNASQSFDEVDLAEAYKRLAKADFLPLPLKKIVLLLIEGNKNEALADLGSKLSYSVAYLEKLFYAARIFIENVLLLNADCFRNNQSDKIIKLTQSKEAQFKGLRQIIREVSLEIESGSSTQAEEA